jgi:Transcriptional regulators
VAKLTDKQKKKIIAEKINGSSLRALAAKYGVSRTTISRVLKSDKEMSQKVTQKKAENTASVLAFMESQKNDVCRVIGSLLKAIEDPEKIADATLNQIATAMGIVIDKYTAREAAQSADPKDNNLLTAIENWQEDNFSDLQEVQPPPAANHEVVETGGVSG